MRSLSLMRSKDERIVAGVCGGFAKFFGVSPTLVRVLFVLCGLVVPYLIFTVGLLEE